MTSENAMNTDVLAQLPVSETVAAAPAAPPDAPAPAKATAEPLGTWGRSAAARARTRRPWPGDAARRLAHSARILTSDSTAWSARRQALQVVRAALADLEAWEQTNIIGQAEREQAELEAAGALERGH